jgi:hypothetical protein
MSRNVRRQDVGRSLTAPNEINAYLATQIFLGIAAAIAVPFLLGVKGFAATPYVRVIAVVVAFLFCGWAFFQSGGLVRRPRTAMGVSYLIFIALNPVYLAIGLIYSPRSIYLATDFVYTFLTVGLFFLGKQLAARQGESWPVANFLKIVIAATATASAVYRGFDLRATPELVVIWLVAAYVAISSRRYGYAFLLLLALLPLIEVLNRALLLAAGGLLIISLVTTRGLRARAITATLIVSASLLFAYVVKFTSALEGSQMSRRVSETLLVLAAEGDEPLPVALEQRVYEAQLVTDAFSDRPLSISIPFGLGHGFTMNMQDSSDSSVINSQLSGAENTHNIHLLPVALLARFGIVGCILWMTIIGFHFIASLGLMRRPKKIGADYLQIVANLFVVLLFLFAIPASSYLLASIFAGLFSGVADEMHGRTRTRANIVPAYPVAPGGVS